MKRLISILLAVMLFCSVIPAAYADSYSESKEAAEAQSDTEIEPRVEEKGWFYRYNEELGRYEKRLWSFTYGKWLTDWIPTNV